MPAAQISMLGRITGPTVAPLAACSGFGATIRMAVNAIQNGEARAAVIGNADPEPHPLTVGSFSKCFGLAGWRLGFLAGPAAFVDQLLKIQDSSVICAPYASQWALARTLGDETISEYLAQKRELLRRRRDALLEPLLAEERLDVCIPGGACFAFVGLPAATDGERFAWELLETARVATVPGEPFGPGWSAHLRLSFGAGSEAMLREAATRIVEFTRRRT